MEILSNKLRRSHLTGKQARELALQLYPLGRGSFKNAGENKVVKLQKRDARALAIITRTRVCACTYTHIYI